MYHAEHRLYLEFDKGFAACVQWLNIFGESRIPLSGRIYISLGGFSCDFSVPIDGRRECFVEVPVVMEAGTRERLRELCEGAVALRDWQGSYLTKECAESSLEGFKREFKF